MLSQQRLTGLAAVIFGYIVKFMAYSFLTPAVLMTFAALVFVYITLVGPELPFLRYLTFLLPIDGRGNASLDGNDIMNAFGLITMAFFMLSVIGGWLLRFLKRVIKRILQPGSEVEESNISSNQNIVSVLKRRLIGSSVIITVVFLIAFVVIPLARMAEGSSSLGMYPIFVIFYMVAMIANVIYIAIEAFSDVVLGWAWAKVVSG